MTQPTHCTQAHATQLFQISNLLRHAGFIKLVLGSTGRFDAPVNNAISIKIGSLLVDDIASYVFHNSDLSVKETLRLNINSDKHLLKRLFNQAGEIMAEQSCALAEDISQSAKRFAVAKDDSFSERALQVVGYSAYTSLNQAISAWTNPGSNEYRCGLKLSYLNQALFALYTFMEAKDSLARPIGNELIESYLRYANDRGADYWLNGYPYDVLVHDKVVAIHRNNPGGFRGLGFNQNRVSTHAWADIGGLTKDLIEEHADKIITLANYHSVLKHANQG